MSADKNILDIPLPSKADGPMDVTVGSMLLPRHPTISVFVAFSITALQLLRESNTAFVALTTSVSKLRIPVNARSPIEATLPGTLIAVTPAQPRKAPGAIATTRMPPAEFGIITCPLVCVSMACSPSHVPTCMFISSVSTSWKVIITPVFVCAMKVAPSSWAFT